MAFCLPTTYFTSALFPSPVVGSVGFVLGTDWGWIFSSFPICYQWWPTIICLNFRRVSMKGPDTPCPHGDSPFLFVKPVHCMLISWVVPKVRSLYVQEFFRQWHANIFLACMKPELWKQGGPDTFILSHFGSSPALQLTTRHAGGLCALGTSVPSLSYGAILHHPAVSYYMVITWMSFQRCE